MNSIFYQVQVKKLMATLLFALLPMMSFAQDDPVIMKINGKPVNRSEFEYSYNKNNAEGVIDKKNVEEYVDLFVNYNLKVEAAKDAKFDTLKSFKDEFTSSRDQQIRPAFITNEDVEKEAQKIYKETQTRIDSMGGMVKASHILLLLGQKATQEQQAAAKVRIDSIYNELKKGANFAELAKTLSDDKQSAKNGGELPWLTKGQTLPAFEKVLFELQKGEMSEPVLTEAGYHIIKIDDKGGFFPYDSVHADILNFIEQRNLREHIIDQKLDEISKAEEVSKEQLLDTKTDEMVAKDMDLKYLIQEYHDGLLLYEISNATVWDKAAKDEAGLANYFKKNKKKYKWETPRYKGIAYHVKDVADVKAVKNAVKNVSFDKWADVLRKTFNNDSVLRIRVEKGIFKQGDNALIDKEVFKKDTTVKQLKDFPIDAVFGKKLKAPQDYTDVRGQVLADYQEEMEKEWVAALRRRYPVEVDESVLKTVNKH